MDNLNRRSLWPSGGVCRGRCRPGSVDLAARPSRPGSTSGRESANLLWQRRFQPPPQEVLSGLPLNEDHEGQSGSGTAFTSIDLVRKDLKPWIQMVELLEAGEMPPKAKPQPTAAEEPPAIDRLGAWLPGRRGPRRGLGTQGTCAAASAQQRRIRHHDTRPDRCGSAADAGIPGGRSRRRRLHQRGRGPLGHLPCLVHEIPQHGQGSLGTCRPPAGRLPLFPDPNSTRLDQ